ncbi:hybrid sensor histidine kinase/response regulator [Paraburkholderia strydomiana]|uniref:hybrid sensor histidine kinase/response regulator n=1 Tax=Paraburkholderia strydomiana TaxID=1245417 RepID=UPI001BEBAC08|nr:ATP-binding protein [Paraburkholderia strydomiana]MBT2795320.1 response regulator [Paraburkholderia strydomiana]
MLLLLLTALLVAVAGWSYALYDLLLAPSSISRTVGPQENHYWTVARFQIAALLAERQLLLYERGAAPDVDEISRRIDVLKSRYAIMANRSDAADMLATLPSFKPTMTVLGEDIHRISAVIPSLVRDPRSADQLDPVFEDIRSAADHLAREIGEAEVAHRDRVYRDFVAKRKTVFIASAAVGVGAIVLLVLFIVYERRRRAFAEQQAATIEAEQRANRAAAEAMLAKNAFLGAVGHELRTPLQRITTAIEVLTSTSGQPANIKVMGQLDRAARQLETQMSDLTDFARLDSGKLSLKRSEIVPLDEVEAAVEDLRDTALRKGVHLETEIEPVGDVFLADAPRLRQIVTNLVSNAIKYTDGGGTVRVRASLQPKETTVCLLLEVVDTGVGIPSDRVEEIFKPFTQLPLSTGGRREGVGMGLAIVKGLVEVMGGGIHVRSIQGEGSTFTVRLPLGEVLHRPEPPPHLAAAPEGGPVPRVLVVDDQEFSREAFEDILAALGLECDAVGTATQAVEKLATESYDVLVFDIELAETTGLEIAKELRARPGPNQQTPIIWVSATPPESHTEPEAAPFVHYLMKPVRVDELEEALTATLGR